MSNFYIFFSVIVKSLWHYSGLKFIWGKWFPPKGSKQLPTGPIWLLGIYVAFWTLALERYEYRLDLIETRVNSIYAQLGATDLRKSALSRIPEIQNMICPKKPDFLKPSSIFCSIIFGNKHKEIILQLRQLIEDSKDKLNGVKLLNVNLQDANLQNAYFENAYLRKANFQWANLRRANFKKAMLWEADLRSVDFQEANLQGADFYDANLYGAKNLTAGQLCQVTSLYQTKLNNSLKKQVKNECPNLLEKPKWCK